MTVVNTHGEPRNARWAWLRRRRSGIQRLIVTTGAVTVAWLIGNTFSEVDALVAAILALITLRASVQDSAVEAFVQLLGTGIGIGIAFGGLALLGDGLAAVPAAVIATLLVARLLRLGDEGALSIAVTALVVVGPGLPQATAIDRAWGTLIGVAVALVFSYWAHPSTPVRRTLDGVSRVSDSAARLLRNIADGVAARQDAELAAQWLEEARTLDAATEALRPQAIEAVRYARWWPTADRRDAESAYQKFLGLEHTVVQVRTIARTFYDASLTGTTLPSDLSAGLTDALTAAGRTVAAAGRRDGTLASDELDGLRETADEAADRVKSADDTDALLLSASVITNLQRIADSLDEAPPAIVDVNTPGPDPTPVAAVAGAVSSRVRKLKPTRQRRKSRKRR